MTLTKVRIGAGAAGFNFLPIFIAQHEQYFERYGVKVEVRRTGSTDNATQALLAGDIQLAVTPPEGAISNCLAGGPLRVIGGNLNALPLTLVANPRFRSIAELKGATLGTSSMTEGTAIYTMEILRRHGLNYPGDYQFSLVGIHSARWAALQAGTLDAALQLIPLNFVAAAAGYSTLAEAYDYIQEIAFISIIADCSRTDVNRDALLGTLKGIRDGMRAMHDPTNDPLSVSLLVDVIKAEPVFIQQSIDLVRRRRMMPEDLSVSSEAMRISIRLMRNAGLLDANVTIDPAQVLDLQGLAEIG